MWAGDSDLSDDGKPVRLYQPILYGAQNQKLSGTISWIGGSVDDDDNHRAVCASCRDSLFLLAQLYVSEPHKRTYQIFGCNRLSCVQGLFPSNSDDDSRNFRENNMLCYGGGGVVVCRRWAINETKDKEVADNEHQEADAAMLSTRASSAAGCWVEDDSETDAKKREPLINTDNEWAVSQDDGNNNGDPSGLLMDDLEAKLAAMETRTAKSMPKPEASTWATKPQSQRQDKGDSLSMDATGSTSEAATPTPLARCCFPCFILHSLQEPPAVRHSQELDPDDVGLGNMGRDGRRKDDAKIQLMLAQYMQEEDDEDILTLLRGESGGNSSSTATVKSGERDERLSATDRALLQYTDRLKRSPQQVLRYAHGGTPLWSIPTVAMEKQQQQNESNQRRGNKSQKHHQNNSAKSKRSLSQHLFGVEQAVPPCTACGAPRVFEFQLVPPLLHILQVDKYAPDSARGGNRSERDTSGLAYYQQGGMDWGNIAVYACSNPACCDGPQEEFCVVQDSIDERFLSAGNIRPHRHMPQGAAVIPEDSKFEDDDENDDDCDSDADLEEGDFDDDDESW